MRRKKINILIYSLLLAALPLFYNSCSKDFDIHHPIGSIESGTTDEGGATGGNPMVPLRSLPLTPQSSRFYLAFCVTGITGVVDGNRRDIYLGGNREFVIEQDGTSLSELLIRNGTYESVSIVARDERCPDLGAVRHINDLGVVDIAGTGSVRITFVRPNASLQAGPTHGLDFTPFLAGLAAARNRSDLNSLFMTTSGYLVY